MCTGCIGHVLALFHKRWLQYNMKLHARSFLCWKRQSPAWQYITGRTRELKGEGTSPQTDVEVANLHNYLVYLQNSAKHRVSSYTMHWCSSCTLEHIASECIVDSHYVHIVGYLYTFAFLVLISAL